MFDRERPLIEEVYYERNYHPNNQIASIAEDFKGNMFVGLFFLLIDYFMHAMDILFPGITEFIKEWLPLLKRFLGYKYPLVTSDNVPEFIYASMRKAAHDVVEILEVITSGPAPDEPEEEPFSGVRKEGRQGSILNFIVAFVNKNWGEVVQEAWKFGQRKKRVIDYDAINMWPIVLFPFVGLLIYKGFAFIIAALHTLGYAIGYGLKGVIYGLVSGGKFIIYWLVYGCWKGIYWYCYGLWYSISWTLTWICKISFIYPTKGLWKAAVFCFTKVKLWAAGGGIGRLGAGGRSWLIAIPIAIYAKWSEIYAFLKDMIPFFLIIWQYMQTIATGVIAVYYNYINPYIWKLIGLDFLEYMDLFGFGVGDPRIFIDEDREEEEDSTPPAPEGPPGTLPEGPPIPVTPPDNSVPAHNLNISTRYGDSEGEEDTSSTTGGTSGEELPSERRRSRVAFLTERYEALRSPTANPLIEETRRMRGLRLDDNEATSNPTARPPTSTTPSYPSPLQEIVDPRAPRAPGIPNLPGTSTSPILSPRDTMLELTNWAADLTTVTTLSLLTGIRSGLRRLNQAERAEDRDVRESYHVFSRNVSQTTTPSETTTTSSGALQERGEAMPSLRAIHDRGEAMLPPGSGPAGARDEITELDFLD